MMGCGICASLLMQTVQYILGNCGITVISWLPLPFLSYGNTSLVVNMAMIGLLCSLMRSDGLYADKEAKPLNKLRLRLEWENKLRDCCCSPLIIVYLFGKAHDEIHQHIGYLIQAPCGYPFPHAVVVVAAGGQVGQGSPSHERCAPSVPPRMGTVRAGMPFFSKAAMALWMS